MLGLAVSQFTLYTNFVYIESDRELIRLALVVLNYLNKVICFASKENPLNDSDFTRSRRVGCRRSSSPPSTAKYEVLPLLVLTAIKADPTVTLRQPYFS